MNKTLIIWILSIIVVILVAALGIAGWFLGKQLSTKPTPTPTVTSKMTTTTVTVTGTVAMTEVTTQAASPTATSKTASLKVYVTAVIGLNLRQGPSTSASIIATMPLGSEFIVDSESNGWYYGTYGSQTGYCSKDFTSTTNPTADWATYTNNTYNFSFKYPKAWAVSEKAENFGDARKLEVDLNFSGGSATSESYIVEVLDAGAVAALQFVNSWYGGIESGPSNITEGTANGLPIVKFFMEKASVGQPAGSANILFKNNSTVVDLATAGRTGNSGQSVADFWNTLSVDQNLNLVASTFIFTK